VCAQVSRILVSRIFHGSVVSGHFAEASSADWPAKVGRWNVLTGAIGYAEVDRGHFWSVLKHLDVACGSFAEASSADWSAKAGCGKVLTGDFFAVVQVSGLEVFAVCQDSNVTCGTFAKASSAEWFAKEGCRNVHTGYSSIRCIKHR
jgi:hypothetical protein